MCGKVATPSGAAPAGSRLLEPEPFLDLSLDVGDELGIRRARNSPEPGEEVDLALLEGAASAGELGQAIEARQHSLEAVGPRLLEPCEALELAR